MSNEDMGIWYRVLWRPSIIQGVNTLIRISLEQDRRDAEIMRQLSSTRGER